MGPAASETRAPAPASQSVFDEHQKAYFGAAALFFLWIVVASISALEDPLFGQSQLVGKGFVDFTIGAYVLIAYFLVLANPNGIRALQRSLARTTGRAADQAQHEDLLYTPGRIGALLADPWVPVTLQFLLVGGLIYASGGVIDSPYSPVPIGMVVIGQNVYDVRPITFDAKAGLLRGIAVFAARVAGQYWYPLSLSVSLLIGLEALQQWHPIVQRTAVPGELAFTSLFSMFVCMCTTFVTRCADRATPHSTS